MKTLAFLALATLTMIAPPAAFAQNGIPSLPRPGAAARQPTLGPQPVAAPAPAATPAAVAAISLTMEAGVGRLLRLPGPAIAVLAADPRIARVQPASPTPTPTRARSSWLKFVT